MARCVFSHARFGNEFVLTDLGAEQARIKAKFDENDTHKNQYRHTVPKKWVDAGFVKEVKEEDAEVY